jgi:hypothetical protein
MSLATTSTPLPYYAPAYTALALTVSFDLAESSASHGKIFGDLRAKLLFRYVTYENARGNGEKLHRKNS